LTTVADPRGGILGQLPPKRLWRAVEWRSFAIDAPFFGAYQSRDRYKKILPTKQCFTLRLTSGFTWWIFAQFLLSDSINNAIAS